MHPIVWDASRPEKNLQISLAAALPEDMPMQFRRPSVIRSVRMTRICAAGLLAAAGVSAFAQPVARQLIDDADVVEVLRVEVGGSNGAMPFGSMHVLEDLDGDGVREFLLTQVIGIYQPDFVDYFKASVRSPGTGKALLTLPVEETEVNKIAHAAAVMIEDIDGDGVRDLAVGRSLTTGVGLRVHSGATGEVIRAPFADDIRFPYGNSMLPWEDVDGDGQADLILGRRSGSQSYSDAFVVWSPGSGVLDWFRPVNFITSFPLIYVTGVTLLDLGVGATGARELLSTFSPASGTFGGFVALDLFGDDPLAHRRRFIGAGIDEVPYPRAAVLGDLTGDGFNEIIMGVGEGGFSFGRNRVAIFSGAIPAEGPFGYVQAIEYFEPQIVADFGNGPEVVSVGPTGELIALDDATGDGFPDFAFVTGLSETGVAAPGALVAACGRTGRAFYAAFYGTPPEGSQVEVTWITPDPFLRRGTRGAIVSPGDLNNDGAPDLLAFVYRNDTGDGSADPIREQLLLTHYLPTPCAGDVDFDRVVNFADLNAVLSSFGAQDITLPADLNASGVVDFADLNLVLSAFGVTCD
jgi:hypothetical protein